MKDELTAPDLEIIDDEVNRYTSAFDRIQTEVQIKSTELKDNQTLARSITSEIVNSQRDEEKQALQSAESVAHGLAKLRLQQSNALSDLIEQPYFARVVYEEKGRPTEFKLGLASFPELRIIDWRKAPISKLYYDYNEGDSYDDEIAGRDRQGKILLKRAYRGKERVLSSIELKDCSYNLSRGAWHKTIKGKTSTFSLKDKETVREILKSHNFNELENLSRDNGYLRNVLSLLTPQQFEMISLNENRPIIIQGSAGTGKTTVALHRLAWLMYEGNSTARPENTLILMFNKSLAAYVSFVLPELGVQNVKICTYFDWAKDILETSLGKTLEFRHEDIPFQVAQFKSHRKTHLLFDLQLASNSTSLSPQALLYHVYESDAVDDTLKDLTGNHIIKNYLDQQRVDQFLDIYDVAFLLKITHAQNNCYRSRLFPSNLDYLIIDEVQDFTIGELQSTLLALEDKNKLTLAGDLGQKILENRDFGNWNELLSEIDLSNIDVLNLNIAYRSTYQIYEFAEFVRNPNLANDDLKITTKFGPEPTLTLCHSQSDAIHETKLWLEDILKLDRSAIGVIICKTSLEARQVYDGLIRAGTRGIRHGDAQHFEFTPGITVTDIKQVKGLEFAFVLLFNPTESNYSRHNIHDRNSLYVAITRAEYKIDMICYDTPSTLIPEFIQIKDLTAIAENPEDAPLFSDVDQDTSQFEENNVTEEDTIHELTNFEDDPEL